MTEQQALNKLTALCARGEHCQQDALDKLRRWEIDMQAQSRIMSYLISEHFIDEERYTRCFIEDKIKGNKWGRRKIEQTLYMKRIPREIYEPVLKEYEEGNNYEEILRPLIEAKRKTVTGKNDYDIRNKLIRFALSRGFDMDTIISVLD